MKKLLMTLVVLGMFAGVGLAQAAEPVINSEITADAATPPKPVKKAKKQKAKKHHKAVKKAEQNKTEQKPAEQK